MNSLLRALLRIVTLGLCLGIWALLAAGTAVAQPPILPAATAHTTRIVAASGPYTAIADALADAQSGDTIEVHGGLHPALVVDKPVHLIGIDWPVLDGEGKGTVVLLAAPDIHFQGFLVRGSGSEPDRSHAGISVTAPRVTVAHNRLEEVLFGVYLAEADDAVVRGNEITGKGAYDLGRKGDGIRLWYSARVVVEQNIVYETRDVVVWYSPGVVIRQNVVKNGRYGIHLMYCDEAIISQNQLLHNSVGAYAMYSYNITISDNRISGQRGPSGYALGFKDTGNVLVSNNVLVDNAGGIFLDGTPFNPDDFARFENNIIAFNDAGVTLQPAVRGNVFQGNSFWENISHVTIQGGGTPGVNGWQGNFWSDYTGFDADGDGFGDVAYQAERFFENLTEREPRLRMLAYSPVVQAIEFAGHSFPIIRPQPKLTDPMPMMQAGAIPAFAATPRTPAWSLLGTAVTLLFFGVLGGGLAFSRPPAKSKFLQGHRMTQLQLPETALCHLRLQNVSKRYGSTQALQNISLTAQSGEAIALWGANGAGKTTLLKAILGLIAVEGQVAIDDCDPQRDGKAARRSIGYVPQEAVFYDWSVQATLQFYARLRKADQTQIPALLAQLGLAEHTHKPVPALSGGLKQRLALAIALLSDPPLLLLDEPTASLDSQARRDYLKLLLALRQAGKTILFASHRLEEVEALASRVLLLEQGRLTAVITAAELRSHCEPEA